MKKILLVLSILTILVSGCVDNGQGPTPTPSPTRIEPNMTEPIVVDTVIIEETEIPVHNIGQSVSDNSTKMTLNSVRRAQMIGSTKTESGKQFLILNITIENISPDKNFSYPGSQFIVLGLEGGIEVIYEMNELPLLKLEKPFNGENIAPGNKRQGEIVFEVPENAKGLKLRFEYSPDSSGEFRLESFVLD